MKPFITLACALLIGLYAQAAPVEKQPTKATVIFEVEIECQGCINKIEKNIAFEKGVRDMFISKEKQTVTLVYNPQKTDVKTLQAAFAKIGKPVLKTIYPEPTKEGVKP